MEKCQLTLQQGLATQQGQALARRLFHRTDAAQVIGLAGQCSCSCRQCRDSDLKLSLEAKKIQFTVRGHA